MFFVIDFETSALDPWIGEPLTLGIVPVTEYGEILEPTFYCEWLTEFIAPDWAFPANLTDTESWWNQKRLSDDEKDQEAWAAAWLRSDPVQTDEAILDSLQEYVNFIEPDKTKRFMCANPMRFDGMWMAYIHAIYNRDEPFHYRNLCLRSMRYGLEYTKNPEFGNARDEHQLDGYIPHHALWDARMEALDLVNLMARSEHEVTPSNIVDL